MAAAPARGGSAAADPPPRAGGQRSAAAPPAPPPAAGAGGGRRGGGWGPREARPPPRPPRPRGWRPMAADADVDAPVGAADPATVRRCITRRLVARPGRPAPAAPHKSEERRGGEE